MQVEKKTFTGEKAGWQVLETVRNYRLV